MSEAKVPPPPPHPPPPLAGDGGRRDSQYFPFLSIPEKLPYLSPKVRDWVLETIRVLRVNLFTDTASKFGFSFGMTQAAVSTLYGQLEWLMGTERRPYQGEDLVDYSTPPHTTYHVPQKKWWRLSTSPNARHV